MGDIKEELNEVFAASSPQGIPEDVLAELQSILRLHSISPQELFYKWESYSMKMGSEDTRLDLQTVRAFKRDVQDGLERETRGRNHHARGADKRAGGAGATPRAGMGNGDVFGMLGDFTPTPNKANGTPAKRKSDFESPSMTKSTKGAINSSPTNAKTPLKSNGIPEGPQPIPFTERQNAGQVLESLNSHLAMSEAPIAPYSEPRIRPTANTDLKKFGYKPMAMRQMEASEVLDDRIDEFMAAVQKRYDLDDSAFGNPTNQSTSEIVAVGRVASDSLEGKLNPASLVLETSRRSGAGLRVPLKVDSLPTLQLFPGQIIAVKGINASGQYFSVSELLSVPLLPPGTSTPDALDGILERVGGADAQPLNYIYACGPYTADDNLDYEPLKALCQKAADESVDGLVLMGPFLDLEHPLIASGDFDLPDAKNVDPETSTLATVFRWCITAPILKLCQAVPSITIIMVPSVRDAVSRHVSWPQEQLPKKELGLPKQVRMVSNPVTLSLNETMMGLSSHDILYELRREEVTGGRPLTGNLLERLPRYLIEQRHFLPLYPPSARENLPKPGIEDRLPTGAMLDVSYLKLGEWWNTKPDVLITPSLLPPFVKVVESILVINPGSLSKRKAAGTYAQMALHPRTVADDERDEKHLGHKVFTRARVDILRI